MFSSHTIFALTGMMTYNDYGTHLATKVRHPALAPALRRDRHGGPCCPRHG